MKEGGVWGTQLTVSEVAFEFKPLTQQPQEVLATLNPKP